MIYVDDPMPHAGRFNQWCHMWTDGDPEQLHAFAESLGLKRKYVQHSKSTIIDDFIHYDLSPSKRNLAMAKGAVYVPLINWLKTKRDEQMKIIISGHLCPKDGCGQIMVKVGAIETVDIHDGKPFDPPQVQDLLGCPEHGGRYFVNGQFLTDWDQVPE